MNPVWWLRGISLVACAILASCGANKPETGMTGRSETKQVPSNYEPGLHIGGYVNVGVRRKL